MKKTVVYIRQSLDKEKQKNSLDMQRSHCLEYAKHREWIVDEIYNEGECSARKTEIEERLQLSRLLDECKLGLIARVIVFKRDRFARNVEQYLEILKQIRASQVELHFAADNEPPLFNGLASDLIESLLAGIAEHEGNNIVRRLIDSKKSAAQKGRWAAGKFPYAYIKKSKEEPGVILIDPLKKDRVKRCYAIAEKEICDKKAADLNDFYKAIKKDKDLKHLDEKQIWKLLTQPLHKGVMIQTIDGEPIDFQAEKLRIVEDDLWETVNFALLAFTPPSGFTKRVVDDEVIVPLLAGVVHCGTCGEAFSVTPKMYKCTSGKGCKNSPHIEKVDHEVRNLVRNYLLEKADDEWDKVLVQLQKKLLLPYEKIRSSLRNELHHLEQRIHANVKQHLESNELISLNDVLLETYKQKKNELDLVESKSFSIGTFVAELRKKDKLKELKEKGFSNVQTKYFLQLVKRVDYFKGIKACQVHAVKER